MSNENQTVVEEKKLVEVLEIEMKANAVNEEDGHNEIRLRDDESVSLAVVRGEEAKGFFKRGANYLVIFSEISEPVEAAKQEGQSNASTATPAQTEQPANASESNDTAQPDSRVLEAGEGSSSEAE